MFYPLTSTMIKKNNKLYLDKIKSIKNNTTDEKELIKKSDQFWEQFEEEIDYYTFVYLTRQFIIGNLYTTTYHGLPIEEDHTDSCGVLEQLALEGILTSNGQRSYKEDGMRSYLDFEFPIEKYDIDNTIQLLIKLYEKGMNVSAKIMKHNPPSNTHKYTEYEEYATFWKDVRYIILFKSDNRTIYDVHAHTLEIKLPLKEIEVSIGLTHSPIDSPNDDCYNIKNIIFPNEYRVKISMFNQKWNDLQADQVLLDSIREMK